MQREGEPQLYPSKTVCSCALDVMDFTWATVVADFLARIDAGTAIKEIRNAKKNLESISLNCQIDVEKANNALNDARDSLSSKDKNYKDAIDSISKSRAEIKYQLLKEIGGSRSPPLTKGDIELLHARQSKD